VNRPTLTVVAGANGAGKGTLTSGNLDIFGGVPVLDRDAFATMLRATGVGIAGIAAGKEVLRLAKKHLELRKSFAVETTLSGRNYLQMMQYARGIERTFEVVLMYIGTESVEINLARIAKRVLAGGHNVPEVDVRRRYARSLQNLPTAAENDDQILLFDNSKELGCRTVALLGGSGHQWFRPLPAWSVDLEKKFR
jgi:predicted ABC-type ATPase